MKCLSKWIKLWTTPALYHFDQERLVNLFSIIYVRKKTWAILKLQRHDWSVTFQALITIIIFFSSIQWYSSNNSNGKMDSPSSAPKLLQNKDIQNILTLYQQFGLFQAVLLFSLSEQKKHYYGLESSDWYCWIVNLWDVIGWAVYSLCPD